MKNIPTIRFVYNNWSVACHLRGQVNSTYIDKYLVVDHLDYNNSSDNSIAKCYLPVENFLSV